VSNTQLRSDPGNGRRLMSAASRDKLTQVRNGFMKHVDRLRQTGNSTNWI